MKVYVVTEGEYSAYGISHIFATRELAQAFLDDFHAREERAAAVAPENKIWPGSYNNYGGYNPDIDEWEVLTEAPPLYEHWAAHWTADTGLAKYKEATGFETVNVYCHEINTELPREDSDPPVLEGVDFYQFMLESPPDVERPYRGPKERPPREASGRGRTPDAAQKALYDKLAFLKAVAEGLT